MGKISAQKNITLVAQPQAFFHELVVEALGRQRIRTRPETEFYLVNLLNQFMSSDHLYTRGGDGQAREEPLALMLKEALETPEPSLRSTMLRRLGDVSLYKAGYFQESLLRKFVDLDYYIGLGGGAYQKAASLTSEATHKNVFEELAHKFGHFVEVLAEVSDKTTPKTEKNLLHLYEVWIKTGSERAEKALKDAGIQPSLQLKKKGL